MRKASMFNNDYSKKNPLFLPRIMIYFEIFIAVMASLTGIYITNTYTIHNSSYLPLSIVWALNALCMAKFAVEDWERKFPQ